ncbi:hypothetical protein [Cryptosporangium aurantiacum]|uniref:Uncharacterized protein n=1 Tax=Cryptosporangium aurantiacum TaxID=134849 RepID=A0A1M7Q9B8_9ACTN|nr:hypothetical protein [Cryptosporangium aurantiacum]SHN27181.1 hypothetical protein SAMN05443668_104344 [Cryptosporangium aurantiacum]
MSVVLEAPRVRSGAAAATAAAICWIALGIDSVARGGAETSRDVFVLLPWVLTAFAVTQLHLAQRPPAGRRTWIEPVGYWAVMVAMLLTLVGTAAWPLDIPALQVLGFPLGVMIWLVAMIAFGWGTVRAGVFPTWAGVLLALLEPGSILTGLLLSPIAGLEDHGNYSAGLEKGVLLLLLAGALRRASVGAADTAE